MGTILDALLIGLTTLTFLSLLIEEASNDEWSCNCGHGPSRFSNQVEIERDFVHYNASPFLLHTLMGSESRVKLIT